MRCVWSLILAALMGLVAAAPLRAASESILDFRSHIVVHQDSSITVTETIKVRSTGSTIKRGIIRDFPTTYKDRMGNTVKVGFQVEEVRRDGQREPYQIEHVANGVKVRIGQKDVLLNPGVHTYTITYRTDRQLGYFKDFDELYWNVTGNGWTFPIDAAEAIIELPPGAKILRHAAYTGPQGARGQDFVAKPGDHEILFKTTRGLGPREGLTVAVAWPKGVVREPSDADQAAYFLRDNLSATIGLIWLVVLGGFYLVAWLQVGRDPGKGTIIPLFTPPQNLSPPAVRFLNRMGYDDKAFAAGVVDMAVKGYLVIQEDDGDFTLVRKNPDTPLPPPETLLAFRLFGGGERLKLENENHERIKGAIDALKENLKKEFEKVYFVTNTGYFICGVVLSLLALGSIIFTAQDKFAAGFGGLWLSIWTVVCYFLAVTVYRKWRGVRSFGKVLGALGATLFALPFFLGEIFGTVLLGTAVTLAPMMILAGMACLHVLFHHLLKAPTLSGRQAMDQIEGFKMYLSVAEKDRLNLLNPPEKTPQLFEKYLPYALALDVENQWSEQFAAVLAKAGVDGQAYSPTWYSGRSWDIGNTSRFSDSLGSSFASAISSSSTAPGSDSGSGGGGSSGGGGGGGGGSGW